MTPAATDWFRRLGPLGRCCVLTVALIGSLAVALPIGFSLQGAGGCIAAIVAAVVVLFSSLIGLLIGDWLRHGGQPMASLLVSMALRMLLPLGACVLVQLNAGLLSDAGFVYFVLAFYLIALPLDTLLAVVHEQPTKAT